MVAYTMVFEGDVRKIDGNPLKIETPLGRPMMCGHGDVFYEANELRHAIEEAEQQLDYGQVDRALAILRKALETDFTKPKAA